MRAVVGGQKRGDQTEAAAHLVVADPGRQVGGELLAMGLDQIANLEEDVAPLRDRGSLIPG